MRGATCLDSPNPKTGDNFTYNCRSGYDDLVSRDAPALRVTSACTARRISMNTGYTGGNCTEDIDECENSQTDCGHGRCQNLPDSYDCVCDFGYCGYNCAMLDPCQENGGQRSAGVPKMADTNVNALLNTRD
nr:PREDICTED: signal peptide, CUB and EGF-like domain-containing protein 2 [Linepithema humile]